MKLMVRKKGSELKASETVIIFIGEDDLNNIKSAIPSSLMFVADTINFGHFKGKPSELIFIPYSDRPGVVICGIGKYDDITRDSLRVSSSGIVNLCRDKSLTEINVILPEIKKIQEETVLTSIAEGIFLANYSFDKYKIKSKEDRPPLIGKAIFHSDLKNAASLLLKIEIISGNTLLCRDLINETSDASNAQGIASEAKKLSRLPGVSCKVYSKGDLEKMKMGLIIAVNRGSKNPPHLVVLRYSGKPKIKKSLALIGKGITFDSGGMNLKPSGHLEDMRTDMAGAAVVMYALKTAAELKLKINLFAVLPLTDNMLSNDSFRPGDVFRAHNGMTVEIGNTDAEGRLVLADAISFVENSIRPEAIIDIATLTGACLVTFGEIVAAYMSNDDELAHTFDRASEVTGEKIWRLPLYSEYEENMKSDIADINNISAEKNAGTIMGGIFLKNFIKNSRWIHIDIAGTARYSKPRGYFPKHATGFGVRLITEVLSQWK